MMCMCAVGPENVDLEDPEMQGVMPRAISQVRLVGDCQLHTKLSLLRPLESAGIQRAETQALA